MLNTFKSLNDFKVIAFLKEALVSIISSNFHLQNFYLYLFVCSMSHYNIWTGLLIQQDFVVLFETA